MTLVVVQLAKLLGEQLLSLQRSSSCSVLLASLAAPTDLQPESESSSKPATAVAPGMGNALGQ